MDFFELVTRGWNGLFVGAVACLLVAAETMIPELFEKGKIGNRLEIPIPIALSVIGATVVPGPWMPDNVLMSQKVVLGILMGFAAYTSTGFVKRYGGRFVGDKLVEKVRSMGQKSDEKPDAPVDENKTPLG